ncbi:MAG: signal peptidase II [Christensenellales bacterium]|jgi:signal peptidase II
MTKLIKTITKKATEHKKQIKLIAIELLIIALLIAADLLTKVYIYGGANANGDIIIIKGVIRFVAEENTGASFGMLKGMTGMLRIFSAISTLALVGFLIYTINNRHKLLRSALILIIGGAAGNLYDRFTYGYVRDFVYFELINYAVFNLADSALTIGCIIFLIYVLFFYNEKTGFASNKPVKKSAPAAEISEQVPEQNTEQAQESAPFQEPEVTAPISDDISQSDNNE